MIQLLYTVILAEMALILTLLFKTPLRKLVIIALDLVKRGRGPVVVKTVAGTVFVVLTSSVYSMVEIQNRTEESNGLLNPTDQVLLARHMLEASLMGFLLFLALMIDRLHHYIRELRLLRKTLEATKKQNRGMENVKNGSNSEDSKASLRSKLKKLESECEAKGKNAKAVEAEAEALRKQSEGLFQEYDRLLEDNQNVRNQLDSIGNAASQSDGKKNM